MEDKAAGPGHERYESTSHCQGMSNSIMSSCIHYIRCSQLTIPAPFIFTAFQRLPFHLHVDCHSTALKEQLLRQDPNTPRFELEVSLIREFIVEPPMQYSTSSRYRGVRRAVLGKSQLTMVENPAESTVVAWAGAIVWLKGNSTFAGFGSFEGNVLSAEVCIC